MRSAGADEVRLHGRVSTGEAPAVDRWSRRLLTVAMSWCLLLALAPAPAQAAISPDQFESCLLTKINEARSGSGVAPLGRAADKTAQVRDWSEWMRHNDFRHMTSAERSQILPPGTYTWAENIAWTSNHSATDCTQVHNLFMNSPGHRANRMNSGMRFAALGAYVDSSGWWVTELFFSADGYPPAPPPAPCPEGKNCDANAYQEAGGRFVVRQGLEIGAAETSFFFGNPGDVAFSGDW
ncbi:MAG: CAP domain-containing protein, partial [Acidimicrobiia bacterium]